ncbi:MAG: 16S rRNA (guanine(966)-N(2))-methyltransferase RsmD [Deltaproteobacteria bacterium]|nr:16S rRNA (guanine(966)-N(2))-methyltransferase RsmD [Deltaproteobacteria bacterium]
MRIIGGSQRGFLFKTPKGVHVRPTTDMIREALFNILQPVSGKTFLDTFAGTGGVGMEALSRGAAQVVFLEKKMTLVRSIWDLAKELSYEHKVNVISSDVKKGIPQVAELDIEFDNVFLDPPYQRGLIEDTITRIGEAGLIGENSVMVVQHSKREPVRVTHEKFIIEQQRKYGDSMLTFIKIKS